MKRFTTLDVVTLVGILACLLLVLMSGCSLKFNKKSPADIRHCCDRVSAHTREMEKFNRYCKVALFLSTSKNTKAVGSGVRQGARDVVKICKFVFNVQTDEELVAAGDEQEYYKVRSYILPSPYNGGWNHPLCDPSDVHCEEF